MVARKYRIWHSICCRVSPSAEFHFTQIITDRFRRPLLLHSAIRFAILSNAIPLSRSRVLPEGEYQSLLRLPGGKYRSTELPLIASPTWCRVDDSWNRSRVSIDCPFCRFQLHNVVHATESNETQKEETVEPISPCCKMEIGASSDVYSVCGTNKKLL